MSETESLVNRLRESKGVLAGILFTTMPDNVVRVSFRSKDSLNVSAIAKSLGGGGHSHAAGLKSTLPLQELKEKIVQAVAQALDPATRLKSCNYKQVLTFTLLSCGGAESPLAVRLEPVHHVKLI